MKSDFSTSRSGILTRMQSARAATLLAAEQLTLIAVSKGQSQEKILQALESGQRVFGENRVQEAEMHWLELRKRYTDIELHLIGPLQTNKAEDAAQLFDVIETLDRPKLADALVKAFAKTGRNLPCYIQVNTGEEPQKGGVLPLDFPSLLAYSRNCGLNVTGLMCIPPAGQNPAPHFALLRQMALDAGLANLSMGMSGDFETAIRFGATHVRIGTALFGDRQG